MSDKDPEDYTLEDMLAMKLNTSICFSDFTLMRVPGGWIYDCKQDVFISEPPTYKSYGRINKE